MQKQNNRPDLINVYFRATLLACSQIDKIGKALNKQEITTEKHIKIIKALEQIPRWKPSCLLGYLSARYQATPNWLMLSSLVF